MANPLINPGNINRVRGSIVIPAHTNLNVTAAYLGKDGISVAPEGDVTTTLPCLSLIHI